jgi:Spy/CpxP family protein refolding chaperone
VRKAVLVMSLLSLSAVPVLAAQNQQYQNGAHKPDAAAMVQRQVKRLTDLLPDLTPAQVTACTTLFTSNAAGSQGWMSSMRAARQALNTAEKNNDTAGIQAASTQIGNLTAQMTANRSTFNASLAQILTADQLKKYKEFGGGGFGGGGRGRRFGGGGL